MNLMNQNNGSAILNRNSVHRLEIQPQKIKMWLERHKIPSEFSVEDESIKSPVMMCMSPWG
jgi:hypothetical protein